VNLSIINKVLFAFSLFVLSSCASQKIVSRDIQFPPPQEGVVKVMTFNIRVGLPFLDGLNCWNNRKNIVTNRIVDNAADCFGLQEALDFQFQHIQQALPQYAVYAVGRKNGKQKGEACPIFYRKDRFDLIECGTFWFSNTPDKNGSKDWGNISPRICSWIHLLDKTNGSAFYVFNLHLDNWSQNSREKSVRLLAERIANRKTKDPFIVMGDFNMELDNPAMKFLLKDGFQTPYPKMTDSLYSVKPSQINIGTRHDFGGRTTGPQIDHIPICENAKALEVSIDQYTFNGRYPSDHFPVVAVLQLF